MNIILFDGVCNLCSSTVSFLIKYDKNNIFKFAASQTNAGENIIRQYTILNEGKSVIFIKEGIVLYKSDAITVGIYVLELPANPVATTIGFVLSKSI